MDSFYPFNRSSLKIEFSVTYYVIKKEDAYGKLKNDGRMIDYVYMVQKPPKYDDVICEQPLMVNQSNAKVMTEL